VGKYYEMSFRCKARDLETLVKVMVRRELDLDLLICTRKTLRFILNLYLQSDYIRVLLSRMEAESAKRTCVDCLVALRCRRAGRGSS
jgi:hypothetical protein